MPTARRQIIRNLDLEALAGPKWDVVLDNHATLLRWVRHGVERETEALKVWHSV